MSVKAEAVVAVSAGFLTMLVFGSIYTFGALTPYISSYLYYHEDATTSTALSILFTSTLFLINVGTFISTMFLSHVSNRLLSILAVVAMSSSVFISSFMTKFVGYIFFYGLTYGFSIGVGYFPPVKNAYLHLPTKKGICSGIIMSGFGLGSALFNIIILELINP
jgi:OFA family oxalate/formate antiporter-like MFS transporter